MGVLAVLMVLITQLFTVATKVTTMGNGHMDADAQTREVFDRMAIDIAQMVKRPDVDYYLKDPNNAQSGAIPNAVNDQLAFYSQVPGYFTTGTATQSPASLVACRVNTSGSSSPFNNKLQRYGCGLVWNSGGGAGGTAMVYSGSSTTTLPNTISTNWPAATTSGSDNNYELAGPQVFRMEYYYVLKGQVLATGTYTSILSDTPWDARIPNHVSVSGLKDVAAITVVLAVIDPKSRILVNDGQLTTLAGKMPDFSTTLTPNPGDLEAQWQAAINSPTSGIPHVAASSLRVYSRTFYLPPTSTPSP